ncbi:MAG: ABC transporter permease [Actinobacteria bacterium]|nr:ABC transporter permease [Actinomycetota bacterium]
MSQALGFLAIGVSAGLVYALLALGIVLVYKGSRTINFAHPFFGLLCAFFTWWFASAGVLWGIQIVPFAANTAPRYAVALVIGLTLIGLWGWGAERRVMWPLRNQPRLVTLVATIALAQVSFGTALILFNRNEEQASVFKRLPTLLNASVDVGTRVVTGADLQVLIVVPLICLGLVVFFTRTRFGVAIRAAAENGEAARLLGISAEKVSTFTWVTGALLAGVAGILITQVRGVLDISTLSTGFLVRGLAAALVGGLTSLPGAVVGGLFVGVSESFLRWWTNDTPGVPETLMFLVVIAILVFRPGGLFGQREETEDKVAFIPTLKDLPARLRDTTAAKAVRSSRWIFVLFAVGISLVTNSKTNGIFTEVAVYAMVGVSLTVLVGFTGQISLGHWGLAGVGAFSVANLFTRLGIPWLLALPLVVIIGMLVSLVIGLPALRIRGLYLAVATLAFNLAAEFYLFKSRLIGGSTAGIVVDRPEYGPVDLGAPSNRPIFLVSLAALLLSILVARNLARSRTGRGFFAVRENEKAAATMGVELTRYKLLAFAASGGIAALAGALYVTYLGFAESTTWTTARSLILIAIIMIGGLGSLIGPILGAFVVIGVPLLFDFANDFVVAIGTGALLIEVIVRARGGLAGAVQRAREALVRGLAGFEQAVPPSKPPAEVGS